MRKNNGTQTVKWYAPDVGEYKIQLKMSKKTDKWVFDNGAEFYNCD